MISPALKESGRRKKKDTQGDKEKHPVKKPLSGEFKNADQEVKRTRKSRRGKMAEKQCQVEGNEKSLNDIERAQKEGNDV